MLATLISRQFIQYLFTFLGTTLLLSILDDSTLWVANVGDSRGVLKNTKGEVIPLSFDHKPSQVTYYEIYQKCELISSGGRKNVFMHSLKHTNPK